MPYYDAYNFSAPVDSYDLYVKLGRRGQKADTVLYTRVTGQACQKSKTLAASGDRWQKIGSFESSKASTPIQFELFSESFAEIPDANRPAIMLVSRTNPVCRPTTDCTLKVDGQSGRIVPVGTLLNEDTLHVVRVTDPSQDSEKSVNYYVDSRLAYKSNSLEPFDQRYVPGGRHQVTRAVQYDSKQQVLFEQTIEKSYAHDFQDAIFRLFKSNQVVLKVMFILLLLGIMLAVGIVIARSLHQRRVWREAHGFIQPAISSAPTPTPVAPSPGADSRFWRISKQVLVVALTSSSVLLGLILLNTYVLQFFRVDGHSMETTLYTGQQMATDRWLKTWKHLLGKEYVPARGEVIVFHKAQSQFIAEEEAGEQEYVVKRVAGLPGEKIIIRGGRIKVYNNQSPEGFDPDKLLKRDHVIPSTDKETVEIQLGAHEIFVIGDNRPASIDSRFNGPIDISEIVGRVRARVTPISAWRTF